MFTNHQEKKNSWKVHVFVVFNHPLFCMSLQFRHFDLDFWRRSFFFSFLMNRLLPGDVSFVSGSSTHFLLSLAHCSLMSYDTVGSLPHQSHFYLPRIHPKTEKLTVLTSINIGMCQEEASFVGQNFKYTVHQSTIILIG